MVAVGIFTVAIVILGSFFGILRTKMTAEWVMQNPSKAMLVEAGAELFSNAPRFVSLVLAALVEARKGFRE